MSAQYKICSDIYQNDLTLVETYAIALNFGSDMCQIKVGIVQVNMALCSSTLVIELFKSSIKSKFSL